MDTSKHTDLTARQAVKLLNALYNDFVLQDEKMTLLLHILTDPRFNQAERKFHWDKFIEATLHGNR